MPDETHKSPDPNRGDICRPPSLWKSKSLRLMLLVTAIGLGLWIYALATAPAPPTSTDPSLVSSFGAAATAPTPAKPRLIDQSAPATFRFGFSFVVGFFLAWLLRRFIKTALLIGGGLATLIIILKATGLIDFNLDSVQSQVDEGLELAQEKANQAKDFILGYVPSAASAATGMFFGARRRS